MSHMDLKINGSGDPKKGPLGQESEAYKRRQLEIERRSTNARFYPIIIDNSSE
ncbi:hypothetical protein MTR_1g013320 [Medicago truncatula]|uniref:Uncharacterized protein n=1 Tax=Medicago truncatula TaxID=3880 RepID=G7I7J3_MEDTR|nr:hypothetical protein MTR_1g013320 [Medicago truncatula]